MTTLESKTIFEREVYIASDATPGGDGTRNKPLRPTSTIESVIGPLLSGRSLKVVLFPGEYTTVGFRVPWRFMLQGFGKDATKIKLINHHQNFGYLESRCAKMFSDNGWSNVLIIRDISLDGNVSNFPDFYNSIGNCKVDLAAAWASRGAYDGVRVIGYGSNARGSGDLGFEAFPLSLNTYSAGSPFQYYQQYTAKISDIDDQTFLEICNCEALGGVFLNGGYATDIFVKTNFPNAGDRQPFGTRTNLAAHVHHNIVRNGSIAYGSAVSEQVLFSDNLALGTKCAFNFDTGEVQRLTIRDCRFLNCNQGINITPNPNSKHVTLERNVISLTTPYFNPITKTTEPFYYVNVGPTVLPTTLVQRDNQGYLAASALAPSWVPKQIL